MDNNQNDGCQGCLSIALIILVGFGLLGFGLPLSWVILYFLIIANIPDNKVSTPPPPPPSPPPPPDDLANILMELSNGEIKDPVTQEIFRPGENVYLCHVHRLAYHEDSWQEMGCRCMVCGNNGHTKSYTLPQPIAFPKADTHREIEIEFRDIE